MAPDGPCGCKTPATAGNQIMIKRYCKQMKNSGRGVLCDSGNFCFEPGDCVVLPADGDGFFGPVSECFRTASTAGCIMNGRRVIFSVRSISIMVSPPCWSQLGTHCWYSVFACLQMSCYGWRCCFVYYFHSGSFAMRGVCGSALTSSAIQPGLKKKRTTILGNRFAVDHKKTRRPRCVQDGCLD